MITGQDSPAVFEGEFVLAAVVLVYFTPITCDMAQEVSERVVTRCPEFLVLQVKREALC